MNKEFPRYYGGLTLKLEYLRERRSLSGTRHSLNPSQAIDPAHLHSVGIHYSLRLPANSPFCISSFFLHPPQDIKAMLGCRTGTKGAASAQRDPLKCKTSEESVARPKERERVMKSDRQEDTIGVLQKPFNKDFLNITYIWDRCL